MRERRIAFGQRESPETVALDRVPVPAGDPRVIGTKRGAREVVVVVPKARLVEAQRRGEAPEHLGIGQGLAERRDRRVVGLHVQVAIRMVDVEVLERRGRRQQHVGEIGGVCAEQVVHDDEEVVAREAVHHLGRLRRDRHGIAVVDEQRAYRRIGVRERIADRRHVDRARVAGNEVAEENNGAPQALPRHAPVSAGGHATARTALPPPAWRCIP